MIKTMMKKSIAINFAHSEDQTKTQVIASFNFREIDGWFDLTTRRVYIV